MQSTLAPRSIAKLLLVNSYRGSLCKTQNAIEAGPASLGAGRLALLQYLVDSVERCAICMAVRARKTSKLLTREIADGQGWLSKKPGRRQVCYT